MIKSPRTSRFAATLAATCLLGLTACGSVSSSSDAFSVNGTGYAEEDFNKLSDVLISAGQFTAINGKIKAADAIVVLRTLIRYEAFLQFIKDNDVKILEADKAEVLKNANADDKFPTYPKELQDVLVNFNIADVTLRKMTPPAIGEIEKLYSDSPASAGVLCLSHILVKTEAEAKTVLADLKSGTKFADVAAKKSIEPGADKSGGSLANGDQPCQALANLQTSFDKEFLSGSVAAADQRYAKSTQVRESCAPRLSLIDWLICGPIMVGLGFLNGKKAEGLVIPTDMFSAEVIYRGPARLQLIELTTSGSPGEVRERFDAWAAAGVLPIAVMSSTTGGQAKAIGELFDLYA